MARILHFTKGPQDWQALLADPEKHWRTGFSARTLAHCWEAADGLPCEIASLFEESGEPLFRGFTPLLAVPEFKVPLPGGDRPSQNDLFLLGRSDAGPVPSWSKARLQNHSARRSPNGVLVPPPERRNGLLFFWRPSDFRLSLMVPVDINSSIAPRPQFWRVSATGRLRQSCW